MIVHVCTTMGSITVINTPSGTGNAYACAQEVAYYL